MKRMILILAVLVLAALVAIPAFATGGGGWPPPKPPEPTCPLNVTDTIAVTPAVWHESTADCPTVTWSKQWYWDHWTLKSFGPITFAYDKSSDPAKCHRPTPASLGIPSALVSDFNHDFPEHKDSINRVNGYWDPPICAVPEPDPVPGCTDPAALNYNPEATVDDQSCQYPPDPVPGCMDEDALNYNPEATVDDESCEYPPEVVPGCMDELAPNYNPKATTDDGFCTYPEPSCDKGTYIWIWDLMDANGVWHHLRDLNYDGTYSAPGVDQQCWYFGCDFRAIRAWGHWVGTCDDDWDFWNDSPQGRGGGACPDLAEKLGVEQ